MCWLQTGLWQCAMFCCYPALKQNFFRPDSGPLLPHFSCFSFSGSNYRHLTVAAVSRRTYRLSCLFFFVCIEHPHNVITFHQTQSFQKVFRLLWFLYTVMLIDEPSAQPQVAVLWSKVSLRTSLYLTASFLHSILMISRVSVAWCCHHHVSLKGWCSPHNKCLVFTRCSTWSSAQRI